MKIVVCVKQVPDSWAEKKLSPEKVLDRASADAVLNDLDEYAVEEALRIVEANGGAEAGHTITLVSMGPERAQEALRKGLSMGADTAIHIKDDALAGSDALSTSRVLAEAIKRENPDLILTGTESTDARMSVIPAMLSERLEISHLSFAGEVVVDVNAKVVKTKRMTDEGVEAMESAMPVIVTVIEKINEPRYPSFKGIMAAKKKPITELALADLGITPTEVGNGGAWSEVKDFALAPARGAGVKIADEGNGGSALVDFLAEKRLI
ncbi:MAG: electron transfer flavoprotein subunit beta/FixA family protein [Actinobacteria bacterium]|nr:electron transfer flavoprotein subunit beta/FixA family protein [Actinomycetota bacterium]